MQEMYKDGSAGELEPFNEKKLKKMLEKEGVVSVNVVDLKEGMRIKLGKTTYKITRIRKDGRISLSPKNVEE
jgi:hypothetical protein